MFHHVHSRKLHDFSNLCFIVAMVTLGLTLLAHRFGIVGAFQPHGQTICEKSGAIRTKRDLPLLDLLDVESLERKGGSFAVMILTAEDPYKLHQRLYI